MATHSSIPAWETPWTEEPDRLQSTGSQKSQQNLVTKRQRQLPLSPRCHKAIFWSMLLLSRFSHARLCATPETAAHQAPLSLGFSRQEHWSGLPFPSPIRESEKQK